MTGSATDAKRALLQLACALLLFAQHIGLAHAVWHAHHQLPSQYLERDASDDPSSRNVSSLCALDAMLGQILGAAPLGDCVFTIQNAAGATPLNVRSALFSAVPVTPRSRGPPGLS